MAKKRSSKSFNLLFPFEPQKTGFDKLYDWVIGPGRVIVVMSMLLVIISLLYRFPLDKQVNDQVNLANQSMQYLDSFSAASQKELSDTFTRTDAIKKYQDLYQSDNTSTNPAQLHLADLIQKILDIKSAYAQDVVVTSYAYTADPSNGSVLKLIGTAKSSAIAEDFRGKLRNETKYFTEVLIENLGSSKDNKPKFSINITIKPGISK